MVHANLWHATKRRHTRISLESIPRNRFLSSSFFASFIHFLRLDAAVFVVRPTQTEHLAFLAFLSLFLRIIKELFTARN